MNTGKNDRKENIQDGQYQRRVRYSGSYPKNYKEKYKELNPDKYRETREHILEKGGTPAGTHVPICVEEILHFLQIKPGQKGLDATLGYGGHSEKMLERLEHKGHLYATDVDTEEALKTVKRLAALGYGEEEFSLRIMNFSRIDELVTEVGPFDFILADLGVSSMQIDNPDRGFSYKTEGPLDLRMNQNTGIPASARLLQMDREEIEGMLTENSDEPYAAEIAKTLYSDMKGSVKPETTEQLRREIEKALSFLQGEEGKEAVKKSCARTFQALRIDVNREYEVLYQFLQKLPEALAPGGKIVFLTFHSGEDKLVKKAFREGFQNGIYSEIAKDVTRPSAEECIRNSRAHSTKMRWAVRK